MFFVSLGQTNLKFQIIILDYQSQNNGLILFAQNHGYITPYYEDMRFLLTFPIVVCAA